MMLRGELTKPLIAYIGGKGAKEGTRFSHAGAIIEGGRGTREGKVEALKGWSYKAEMVAPRQGPKSVSLALVCDSGRRFDLTGTARTNIPVIALTGGYAAVVNEAHTEFFSGDRTGYGVSEFMEQLI